MNYVIALLHGLFSVLAPCIICMLPIYIVYLDEKKFSNKTLFFTASGIIFAIILFGLIFRTALATTSLFISFRHVIILLIVIFIFIQMKIIRLPNIPQFNFPPHFHFFTGMAIATSWIPCISYFYIPIILIGTNSTMLNSILLYTIYSIGLLIPLILLTSIEKRFLKKIQKFSIQHQQKIKYIAFGILLIVLVTLYFLYSADCIECLNLIK